MCKHVSIKQCFNDIFANNISWTSTADWHFSSDAREQQFRMSPKTKFNNPSATTCCKAQAARKHSKTPKKALRKKTRRDRSRSKWKWARVSQLFLFWSDPTTHNAFSCVFNSNYATIECLEKKSTEFSSHVFQAIKSLACSLRFCMNTYFNNESTCFSLSLSKYVGLAAISQSSFGRHRSRNESPIFWLKTSIRCFCCCFCWSLKAFLKNFTSTSSATASGCVLKAFSYFVACWWLLVLSKKNMKLIVSNFDTHDVIEIDTRWLKIKFNAKALHDHAWHCVYLSVKF